MSEILGSVPVICFGIESVPPHVFQDEKGKRPSAAIIKLTFDALSSLEQEKDKNA